MTDETGEKGKPAPAGGGTTAPAKPTVPPQAPPKKEKGSGPVTQELPDLIVELGDERNRTITVDTFKLRLRGRWSGPALMAKTGRTIGDKLAGMPDIPGIHIAVFGSSKEIMVYDLLNDPKMKAQLETIEAGMRRARQKSRRERVQGVPDVRNTVSDDELKSFLLEVRMHLKKPQPSMRIIDGDLPSTEYINKLPGHEIYDPWSNNPLKPRYVKDVVKWKQQMSSAEFVAHQFET